MEETYKIQCRALKGVRFMHIGVWDHYESFDTYEEAIKELGENRKDNTDLEYRLVRTTWEVLGD